MQYVSNKIGYMDKTKIKHETKAELQWFPAPHVFL